jgi:hypothetical protein
VKGRDRLEDEIGDGKITLHETDVKEMRSGRESVSCESGQGSVAGSCKHSNQHSLSMKGEEICNQLIKYYLLKEDPIQRNINPHSYSMSVLHTQ